MKKILSIGDVGLDEYVNRNEIYIGGCAFNVYQSLTLADKILLCPLGDDEFSQEIRRALAFDARIHLPFFPCAPSRQTIDLFESGEKNFLKFFPGPWEGWRAGKSEHQLIENADLCHTVIYEQNVQAVNSCLFGQKWSIDFSTMKDFNEDVGFVKEYMPFLRFAFFGLDASQEVLKKELIRLFNKTTVELVITLGSQGSEVYYGGENYACSATKVDRVIDTTGAGDAFIGAYLSARAQSLDVSEAMSRASNRSSQVIQKISLGEQFRLR